MLTKGFHLGTFPVTQEQWQAIMGNNPSRFKGRKRPVETVSWDDCVEFCDRLGQRTGMRIRLPTEAEWEYACRAGTSTAYHFGNELEPRLANYAGSNTSEVGSYPPNAWGLYDMHGNVSEWCQDWYGPYPQGDSRDPQGSNYGDSRLLRGGSWYSYPVKCRSARRNGCRAWLRPLQLRLPGGPPPGLIYTLPFVLSPFSLPYFARVVRLESLTYDSFVPSS